MGAGSTSTPRPTGGGLGRRHYAADRSRDLRRPPDLWLKRAPPRCPLSASAPVTVRGTWTFAPGAMLLDSSCTATRSRRCCPRAERLAARIGRWPRQADGARREAHGLRREASAGGGVRLRRHPGRRDASTSTASSAVPSRARFANLRPAAGPTTASSCAPTGTSFRIRSVRELRSSRPTRPVARSGACRSERPESRGPRRPAWPPRLTGRASLSGMIASSPRCAARSAPPRTRSTPRAARAAATRWPSAILEVIRGDVPEKIRFLRPRPYTVGPRPQQRPRPQRALDLQAPRPPRLPGRPLLHRGRRQPARRLRQRHEGAPGRARVPGPRSSSATSR